jgi:hydrogenase expression/formation protein HypD
VRYVDEYRDAGRAAHLAERIRARVTRPWTLMEICGGQTHAIVRYGVDELLPDEVRLVHGPGCPVCVTPVEVIDRALALAARPDVTLCTFGDMLRVPGSSLDLAAARARGADVRVLYAPTEAVEIARAAPDREVVLLAVGFETTAPAHALTVKLAEAAGLTNLSLLVAHVLVPPAMSAILGSPDCEVQAFLAAGHVCTVAGTEAYRPLAERYRVPIVVTGFEPVDILEGVAMCVDQLEDGRHEVENQYARSVQAEGNPAARAVVDEVFEPTARRWRGVGDIDASGLRLRPRFAAFDAETRFGPVELGPEASGPCIAGEILLGKKQPVACPAFGTTCTPRTPLGAPMVSSEGACAAYYRYRREAS